MKAKPGQIRLGWSSREQDIVFAWGGGNGEFKYGGSTKSDAGLIMYMLQTKYGPLVNKATGDHPTFLEELEARGYDLSTLKISIEKKKVLP